MSKLDEFQVLTNIRLSHAQKYILAKLMLPDLTPLTAYASVSNGKNVVANRDILVKLGMVKVGANEAEITEQGLEALKNENLVDDMGSLTQTGEQYAYAKDLNDLAKITAQDQAVRPATGQEPVEQNPMGLPGPENTGDPLQIKSDMGESWSMISDMQDEMKYRDFVKNHGKKS